MQNTKYCGEDFVGVTACKARERLQLNPQLFSRDLFYFKIRTMIMFMMIKMIIMMIMMIIMIIKMMIMMIMIMMQQSSASSQMATPV